MTSERSAGASWQTAGIREVLLPSGWRVKGVLPSAQSLARRDKLPSHLFEAAAHLGDREWSKEPEHRALLVEFIMLLMTSFPRETMAPDSDTWAPATMTPEDVATMEDLDVDLLEDLVLRLKTPDQVTAASEEIIRRKAERAAPVPDETDVPRGTALEAD